jgi:phospholipid transport system transporter-binding protein
VKRPAVAELGDGRYAVSGLLRLETVPALWRETRGLFARPRRVVIDFSGVSEVDSAGLALLIEWMRDARRAGGEVHFENIPRQMQAIARVSRLEGLLP